MSKRLNQSSCAWSKTRANCHTRLTIFVFLTTLLSPGFRANAQQMSLPGAGERSLTPDEKIDAAAIMQLADKIEDATVRGDVAFVDSVTSPDFIMVHGAGWTTGGKVAACDDKAAYLKRVQNHEYLVHDVDKSSIHFEMHGDVAITWGRYLSLFVPAGRNTANPPRLSSIWFERVYQKQDGKWMYLSHRSVRTQASPAGVDPGQVTTLKVTGPGLTAQNGYDLVFDGTASPRPRSQPGDNAPANHAVGGIVEEQANTSADAQEILELERKMGEAIVNGDTAFYNDHTAVDFSMTHGDIWTRGGEASLIDNKETFGNRVKNKQYLAYILDHQMAEIHGNVAITHGRYLATLQSQHPDWFSCWFEKVYEKRDGKWVVLSHRTVHGATHGPTKESVEDK